MASAFSGARKNRLDLSVGIALGSAAQIALFVAPVLVLLSYVIGPDADGSAILAGAVVMMLIATMTASLVTNSGRSAWFVGVLVLMVYSIFAMTLYLLPPRCSEPRPAPSRLWASDRGLSIFLAVMVALIVGPALGPVGLPGLLLRDALVSLMLVSGTAAVADRPRAVLIVSVITGAALLVRWASWLFPTAKLGVWREISTLAALVALCWVVLALVFRRGPITTRRLEGAIAVYLLLGFTWAHAYELVALWHPGAFTGAVDGDKGSLPWRRTTAS